MNSLSKRVIGLDEEWDALLSSGIIVEGDSEEGIVYVTDGEKWGAMDWQRNPIIPIKYDSVQLYEFQYACFHFVCKTGNIYDIYNFDGTPIILGTNHYDVKIFFSNRYFICLANSYKRGGRCIAGIEMHYTHEIQRHKKGNPRWIRPIAETQYGEIPNNIANNIHLLSFVELKDGFVCPNNVHTENVCYSQMEVLPSTFSADTELLNQFVDNVHHSIFGNRGKAVSVEMASGLDYSLMFIHVNNANAYIDKNREKSKNRMRFTYYGSEYDFPITDPTFIERLKQNPEGYLSINDVYLTISLGLEFEGWHHKLVAGVIMPNTTELPKEIKPDWFDEYEQELARLMDKKNEIEEQINEVRANILQQMESHGIEKIRSEQFSVSYTPARTVVQFDSKAFRTENEELYSNYCRPKLREASIVVKRNVKD